MPNGASEILGFNKSKFYNPVDAGKIKMDFNSQFSQADNQYSPLMVTLEDQNGLGEYLDYINTVGFLIVGIFLVAMSVVLLNTGLMSGIRRYGEVGVRLALGEAKNHIYQSMLYESVLIGFAGSVIGTGFGLAIAFYLQEYGIDITETLRTTSIMMSNILRARISVASFYIGFIPGLLATLIGTAFSGIQIFQRQTASLFKELEV
jgi:putative ABC transport system permease protein